MTTAVRTTAGAGSEVVGRDLRAGAHRLRVYTCGDPSEPPVVFCTAPDPA